jgi:hypothetical protein
MNGASKAAFCVSEAAGNDKARDGKADNENLLIAERGSCVSAT